MEGAGRSGASHFLSGQASHPWSLALQQRQKCSYLHLPPSLHSPSWNLRQVVLHLDEEEEDEDEEDEDEEEAGRCLLLLLPLSLSLLCLEGERGVEAPLAALWLPLLVAEEEEDDEPVALRCAFSSPRWREDCIMERKRVWSGTAGSRPSMRQALRCSSRYVTASSKLYCSKC